MSPNRTIVELKFASSQMAASWAEAPNRTIVELKSGFAVPALIAMMPPNRTIVELKFQQFFSLFRSDRLLIVQ